MLVELLGRGIPVIAIDCDSPEKLRTAYIGIDNEAVGSEIGGIALEGMMDSDRALLVYSEQSPDRENLKGRIQGIRQVFAGEDGRLDEFVIRNFAVQTVLELWQRIDGDPSPSTKTARCCAPRRCPPRCDGMWCGCTVSTSRRTPSPCWRAVRWTRWPARPTVRWGIRTWLRPRR